jgi:energy-coupling factor transporter ATP-binding protein EcfA2
VAEPFRVPVIANFPCNFSTEAARRLVSIVASGARCGVFPVISVDTTQEFPTGFSLANLEQNAASLVWQGDRYVWQDPDFGKFALDLATPPSDEFSTRLLQKVGELAKQAKRVEVPFDFIAPPPEQWWTSQSGPGIDVALGRVGATKRQHLRLGQGTSQHVLVAGKTGSGKSTLMHALITNLTLSYSPEELELYLIDFKKGVEFKSYASSELPHARVIAIEGEREFGLSVLQRLDVELKRRAEMFREAGVQDVKSFREARPKEPLPRILLIVDEFQEFFVEDDKISQDCSQLLDRLVRQGRAFGLHLLLGSQTLGGAYTLARSTIDQMAVRIALQCSEVDANLILSDDNSAARLLSRPGEAIYNDANGLVEGNNPFQVVWLSEARREQLLERVRDLDRQRNSHRKRTQVVFEGNAPARIEQNAQILSLLAGPSWPTGLEAFQAWLGDPIAIQAPTSATFRRQTGANLLAIGQDESLALGISLSSLISLALQHAPATAANLPSEARFILFDGTPPGTSLTGTLARCSQLLQHSIRVAGWRELDQVLGELLEELERRQKNEETVGATQYLFIHGLQRFRDLRRDESDFGFSSGESKPAPDKKLATLLREGPGLGIHTIVWCDTLNNATRAFDRSSMREFEMHVLLQMSANDSSNLIDSPLAAKLGANRAYVHSEEQSKLEKFRPYGLPKEEWLTKVGEILRGR